MEESPRQNKKIKLVDGHDHEERAPLTLTHFKQFHWSINYKHGRTQVI